MKYIAVIDTDDYKDLKFYEDANGEYLVARDANAEPDEWIALHFIKAESEEYSEIKNDIEDLSKRVEVLEKQMQEDKEEQLKKLKAEIEYAKFRCALHDYCLMERRDK